MISPVITLENTRNNTTIPAIGLGTWRAGPGECAKAVEDALKAGYRHLDCAWAYANEVEVGKGIQASGVPRSEIFITSKLWGTYHDRVPICLEQTLTNLGTDYLDLYLVHWPLRLIPNGEEFLPLRPDGSRDVDLEWPLSKTWKAMEALVSEGKVKAIGLSNASQKTIEELLPSASIKPAVNQLELHLYNPQLKLLAYLASEKIVAQAYSPLGSAGSPLLADETASSIAKAHSLQTSDVLLGYLLKKSMVILPKTVSPTRMVSNLKGALAAQSALTEADMEKLDSVAANGKQKRFVMPAWGVDLGFENWP